MMQPEVPLSINLTKNTGFAADYIRYFIETPVGSLTLFDAVS